MNRTERAEWIDEMKSVGKYQHIIRSLVEGENETNAINGILGILDYTWGGIIVWRRMWTHYPKFGNPVINIELVTNRVVDVRWVKDYLPMSEKISFWDNDFPRHYWKAIEKETGADATRSKIEQDYRDSFYRGEEE
jgi:hypothetical protein